VDIGDFGVVVFFCHCRGALDLVCYCVASGWGIATTALPCMGGIRHVSSKLMRQATPIKREVWPRFKPALSQLGTVNH